MRRLSTSACGTSVRGHRRQTFVLAFAALAALQGRGEAQLKATVCTEGIGLKSTYTIEGGRPGFPFLFLTSFQRSNFPLSAIDPRDTRTLGVGLELLSLLIVAPFDATGGRTFALPIPNDTNLAGQGVLHQILTYPGTTTTFGDLSDVLVVPLEVPGAWRQDITKAMFYPRAWTSIIDEGDGNFLVAGGGSGALLALTSVDTTDRFDASTRTFTPGPKMTVERGVHTVSELAGNKWLLAGGVDRMNDPQATCDLYDAKQHAFSAAPAMNDKRMAHTATVLSDGRVFVTGGLSDMSTTQAALVSSLKSTEIYDPVTNKWTKGPDMSEGKAGHGALLLPDGRVLLSGGLTYTVFLSIKIPQFSKAVDIYDPKTNTMKAVAAMNVDRAGHGIFELPGGKVLVAGGIGGAILSGGVPTSGSEIYDPAQNRWTTTGSLPLAKGLAGAVVLSDGSPAMIGGAAGSFLAPLPVDDCAAYDVAKGTWSALPKLVTPRATHAVMMGSGCAVFAIGGATGASNAAVTTAEALIR
ncbi:MAG: hypothetical protein H6834_00210 [Planctomycetes bacterium]|nr:hypothetical protein [Planctomycetota bacterium]